MPASRRVRLLLGRRRLEVVIAVLAAVAVTVPATVWASHQFSDVPDTHPFHDEISAVAGAGVTTGFPDGTFRPGNNITRQAAAAFFERGLGRLAWSQVNDFTIGNGAHPRTAQITTVGVEAGAAGNGNGLVYAQASFTAYVWASDAAACPCDVEFWLARDGQRLSTSFYMTLPAAAGELGAALQIGAVQGVSTLAADTSAAYQLYASLHDANVSRVQVRGILNAVYVPFGPDGDATVAYEHTCTPFEVEPNNGAASANAMPGGGCIRGRLSSPSDADVFSLGISAGQTIVAETKSPEGAGCAGPTRLRLSNVSGVELASDTTSGIGVCSRLTYPVTSTGTYYLEVTPSTGNSFEYRLETTLSSTSSAQGARGSGDTGEPEDDSGSGPQELSPPS